MSDEYTDTQLIAAAKFAKVGEKWIPRREGHYDDWRELITHDLLSPPGTYKILEAVAKDGYGFGSYPRDDGTIQLILWDAHYLKKYYEVTAPDLAHAVLDAAVKYVESKEGE
jgi:hypothetical protein